MPKPTRRNIEVAIERKAEEVRRLAAAEQDVKLDRLRDETAALQAIIAEARRLQLLERRFDTQGTAVLSPVLIESEEFARYCQISDLSPEGMKATVYGTFSRQQSICVRFTSHELVQGKLVWSESNQIGVQFDRKIDVASVLASLGRLNTRGAPDRATRLPVRCLAEVSSGPRFGIHEVRDVSQYGVKVLATLGRCGQKVAVQLDELDERDAVVRWSRPGSAGLVFSQPLSFHELGLFASGAGPTQVFAPSV